MLVRAGPLGGLAGRSRGPGGQGRLEDDRLKLQNDVRLGGIYGLKRVADRASGAPLAAGGAYRLPPEVPGGTADPAPAGWWASQDRVLVFEILSAYVRTTSHRPPVGPGGPDASLQVRQPDVNAAVTVLARRTVLGGDPPLDLSGSLLGGARLGWARLAGAKVSAATSWPSGFDWRTAGARLVESC